MPLQFTFDPAIFRSPPPSPPFMAKTEVWDDKMITTLEEWYQDTCEIRPFSSLSSPYLPDFCTPFQWRMFWLWRTCGVRGLQLIMAQEARSGAAKEFEQAQKEKTPQQMQTWYHKKHWDTMMEDWSTDDPNTGNPTFDSQGQRKLPKNIAGYYLSTIPPALVEPILANTLPSTLAADPDLAKSVEYWTATQGVGEPGVYAVCVTDENGCGPSPREMIEICDTMRRYLDINDTAFIPEAKEIDEAYRGDSKVDYDVTRRYATKRSGKNQSFRSQATNWLESVKPICLDVIEKHKNDPNRAVWMDTPMKRVFFYIGWANILGKRSSDHIYHAGTENQPYGLFAAVCRYLYGKKKYSPRIYTIFRCVEAEHAGILEVIGHFFASSFVHLGGFNVHWPGGRGEGQSDTQQTAQAEYDYNRKIIEDSGNITQNLADSLAKCKVTSVVYGRGEEVTLDETMDDFYDMVSRYRAKLKKVLAFAMQLKNVHTSDAFFDAADAFDQAPVVDEEDDLD